MSLCCLFLFIPNLVNSQHAAQSTIIKNQTTSYYVDKELLDYNKIINVLQFNIDDAKTYHLFSHGEAGMLLLNNEWKSPPEIVKWLKKYIDITNYKQLNIYGCNFAKGVFGKTAVQYLEHNLGISIAASNDITGIDGDWVLEVGSNSQTIEIPGFSYNLQSCNCTDFLFVNDTGPDLVHKFEVLPDGSVQEVFVNGMPFLPPGVSPSDPHGIASDINGNIYIADIGRNGQQDSLFVFNCAGEPLNGGEALLDAENFLLRVNNFASFNEFLYFVNRRTTGTDIMLVDPCSADTIGRMAVPVNDLNAWGFHIDPINEFRGKRKLYNCF